MKKDIKSNSAYSKYLSHYLVRYMTENSLDSKQLAKKLNIDLGLLSNIIHGKRDPISTAMKTLKKYASLYGDEPSSIIRFIADLEKINIDKITVQKKNFVSKLEDSFSIIPDFFRMSLIHKRIANVNCGKLEYERWLFVNAIYLLLLDIKDHKHLSMIIELVMFLHQSFSKVKLDEDDIKSIKNFVRDLPIDE